MAGKKEVAAIKFTREAAEVRRHHTRQYIGEYNVGLHSFNMLSMLRVLWPGAPHRLIWAILEHDLPELMIGDIPATAKNAGVTNPTNVRSFERSIIEKVLYVDHYRLLTDEEHTYLKFLDTLELFLFCRDQIRLGNMGITNMMNKCIDYLELMNLSLYQKSIILEVQNDNSWDRIEELDEW